MLSRRFRANLLFAAGCASRLWAEPGDTVEVPELTTHAHRPDHGPGGRHRLDSEELRRFASLEEALDALPGFRVRRQGGLGGYSELSFRGARAADVDITIDGIRLNMDGDAAPDLSKWPLLWFSSLEARTGMDADGSGPGTLARIDLSTGNSAASGVAVETRMGSFSTAEGAATLNGGQAWRWALGLEGQWSRNSYPFFSDNGTLYNASDDGVWNMDNNAYWSRGFRAGAKNAGPAGGQSLSLLWLQYRKQYPGLFPQSARAYTLRDEWLGAWRVQRFAGEALWEAGLQARRFHDSYRDPAQSLGYLSFEDARRGISAEAEGKAGKTTGRFDLGSDVRLRLESIEPTSTPYVQLLGAPAARRFEAQLGSKIGARLTRAVSTSVEARASGARFETDNARFFPSDSLRALERNFLPFALRAGTQWSSAAGTFGWLGRIERHAASSSELLGDNNGIKMNPRLQSEAITSLGLLHACRGKAWQVQSSAFWNRYSHPIRLAAYGASPFLRYENGADYEALGLESDARGRAKNLRAALSVTLQHMAVSRGMSAGDWPAFQSPVESHAELYWTPGSAECGPMLDFRGPYYPGDVNLPGTRRSPEWDVALHAGAHRGPARLALDARNLLDHHTRDFAYSVRSGRSYSLTTSVNF